MVWTLSLLLLCLLGLTLAVLGSLVAVLRRLRAQSAVLSPGDLAAAEQRLREGLEVLRRGAEQSDAQQRRELGETLERHAERVRGGVSELSERTERQLNGVSAWVTEKLPLQVGRTVDERFKSEFVQVETLLKEVRARLVQLEGLSSGVGALRDGVARFSQMLGNVKARGTWGEWQLGNILSDMLAPGQFATNVHPNPRAQRRVVEFAIALPGDETREQVWLPIDSKFPQEDYERLLEASRVGDREAEAEAKKALVSRVKAFAREVSQAYIFPPYTTDFAILFLPTEGLYLEMLGHGDAVDEIQRQQKVLLAGPTTLAALINALQMGFQTLAVQKNTVKVLDALKRVRDTLDSFEKQHERLVKNLHTATAAAEEDAKRIQSLKVALKRVTFAEGEDAPSEDRQAEAERNDA